MPADLGVNIAWYGSCYEFTYLGETIRFYLAWGDNTEESQPTGFYAFIYQGTYYGDYAIPNAAVGNLARTGIVDGVNVTALDPHSVFPVDIETNPVYGLDVATFAGTGF